MEQTYPLVSIALCTYNGEEYLREQLDTLVNQTYPNIEIIAVDDCSSDSTVEILDEYSKKVPNFQYYINDKNLGFTKNYEKAISLCNGEYIAIADQDDIWDLNKITLLKEHIGNNILIYAKSLMVNSNGESLGYTSMHNRIPYSGNDPRITTFISLIWGHNMLFRKDLIAKIFPLNSNIKYYDWFISITSLNYGTVLYFDEILVYRRVHENNATTNIHLSKAEYLSEIKIWLKSILEIKDLRYIEWFQKMDKLFSKNNFISRFMFLYKYKNILFKVSSKSHLSKLNEIRKLASL